MNQEVSEAMSITKSVWQIAMSWISRVQFLIGQESLLYFTVSQRLLSGLLLGPISPRGKAARR
jgi:hypothetical protein